MALTSYQIEVLRLLSKRRRLEAKESYVASGTALNFLLNGDRLSNDIDIFHDTDEALFKTWMADKNFLTNEGYEVAIVREVTTFVEAEIIRNNNRVVIQWLRDSAFRFFPLIEDELLGLTLHPFDLATNKVLALNGRLEPRDWIDTIQCSHKLQQLGYLAWAACGKDPGVNPDMLLADASRLHYSQIEIDTLAFESNRPLAAQSSIEWKKIINVGKKIIELLPEEHIGECILHNDMKSLYDGSADQLAIDLSNKKLSFHKGSIHGAWPSVVGGVPE